jgi:hypothetical protein
LPQEKRFSEVDVSVETKCVASISDFLLTELLEFHKNDNDKSPFLNYSLILTEFQNIDNQQGKAMKS